MRTKINSSYSLLEDLLLFAPKGSVLEPSLFNVYVCELLFKDSNVAKYANAREFSELVKIGIDTYICVCVCMYVCMYVYIYIYIYVCVSVCNMCNHENNVPSWLSPQWLCGNSCILNPKPSFRLPCKSFK